MNPNKTKTSAPGPSSSPAELPHVTTLFAQKMASLNRALDRQAEAVVAARTEMSLLECRVLSYVAAHSPVSIRDVASGMFLDQGQTSRLSSRLTELGYLARTRSEEDQRSTFLTLTRKGSEVYERMRRSVSAWNRSLMEQISPEEFKTVDRVIDQLTRFVEAQTRTAAK
jgi:DNA-binding MarR family transcriptional regulator